MHTIGNALGLDKGLHNPNRVVIATNSKVYTNKIEQTTNDENRTSNNLASDQTHLHCAIADNFSLESKLKNAIFNHRLKSYYIYYQP